MFERHGEAQKGKFCTSPQQYLAKQRYMASQKDGTRLVEITKKEVKPKSWDQVKCHWGLVIMTFLEHCNEHGYDTSYFIKGIKEPTGIAPTKELLHDCFYAWCPMYAEDGERITMSDERCTTVVAMKWFDDLRRYLASNWGCWIPEPDKNWKEQAEGPEQE